MVTTTQNNLHNKLAIAILAAILIILAILQGCRPSLTTCNRLYPPSIRDSSIIVEKLKLDTAYIILPGDTTVVRVPIPCPDYEAYVKNNKNQTHIIIKDKVMTVTGVSKEDSIRIVMACQEKYESLNKTKIQKVEVIKYQVPKWVWILLIILGVYVTWKLTPIIKKLLV